MLVLIRIAYSELGSHDCPVGIGAAFRNPLCAVNVQYSAQVSRPPSIIFEDGVLFAKIVLGKCIYETSSKI